MHQTWENAKKPNLGPDLAQICPLPPIFFCGFYLYYMLEIVSSYPFMQF